MEINKIVELFESIGLSSDTDTTVNQIQDYLAKKSLGQDVSEHYLTRTQLMLIDVNRGASNQIQLMPLSFIFKAMFEVIGSEDGSGSSSGSGGCESSLITEITIDHTYFSLTKPLYGDSSNPVNLADILGFGYQLKALTDGWTVSGAYTGSTISIPSPDSGNAYNLTLYAALIDGCNYVYEKNISLSVAVGTKITIPNVPK